MSKKKKQKIKDFLLIWCYISLIYVKLGYFLFKDSVMRFNILLTRGLRAVRRPTVYIILLALLLDLALPKFASAQEIQKQNIRFNIIGLEVIEEELPPTTNEIKELPKADPQYHNRLPLARDKNIKKVYTMSVTAYSSDPAQTDDTPCITASGFDVCENGVENIIAANFLPIGSYVKMPEIFGDRIFRVEDRMNSRYHYRVDVWMTSKERARMFGIRKLRIEVY